MSQTLSGRWRRLRIRVTHLTAGGSWAVQLSEATQRNLRHFFFDGMFISASDSIMLTYLSLFILALGASSADIGLMTALASLSATLLLIPGAMLVDKIGNRKKIVLAAAKFPLSLGYLFMAITPFILKGPSAVYAIIAIKVIVDGLRNFALPAWVSMTGDVVPLAWRGRYFATRNLVMGFAAMLMTYGIGQLISALGEPVGYQWAIGLAFVFGLLSAGLFAQIRDYRDENHEIAPQSYKIKALFNTLGADRNFLAFCGFTALWTLSLNIAGPFFNVFLVDHDQAGQILAGVADDHCIGDVG